MRRFQKLLVGLFAVLILASAVSRGRADGTQLTAIVRIDTDLELDAVGNAVRPLRDRFAAAGVSSD